MTNFETPPIQPDLPPGRMLSLQCPDCGTRMDYRGERVKALVPGIREEIFYCPVCDIEILRPRKI
jgi:predicted RNA-binding Zn-ribbon protein involved in translation (DUF1610 family)